MTKVIVDRERLEQLLERFIISCPLYGGVAKEGEISMCGLETCLSDENYCCWKEWLKVKELPQQIQLPSDLPKYAHYTKGYGDGWNACIETIVEEEND